MNNDNETPLHCAAQYGHTQVARLLLEELTDPTMRNNKFETPLDLAALYGRLEVVKLLLSAHPNLLGCNTKKHTPLHLASRNGHLGVVEVLLDTGMDINYETERGSALHEAALYGKADVVQRLLGAGIEASITDIRGLTALDTVREMPSQKSREIAALIHGHMVGKPPDLDLPPPPIPPPQESPSPRRRGDLEKMGELISGMAPRPEEESPYEALFEATSCHSLDSLASGKSSDRDSGRPDSDAGKKERLAHPCHPVAGHEEEMSSEALYTHSSIDERGEPAEEEEEGDHTYELLFSAQTRSSPTSHKTPPTREEKNTVHSSNSVLPQHRKTPAPNDQRPPGHKTKDSLQPPGLRAPGGSYSVGREGGSGDWSDVRDKCAALLVGGHRLLQSLKYPAGESDVSQPSEEQPGAGVPVQFTGLLHGSSPVFDCREEPFRLPGVTATPTPASQPKPEGNAPEAKAPEAKPPTKAKAPPTAAPAPAAAAAATPSTPRPNMAAILTDFDPKAIYATVSKEPRDGGGGAGGSPAGRMRPPGDLKLARSLSKSDSDLLVSPPGEEDGCLGSRSESVSNCSAGKKRLEKSPSFTSEWDEAGVTRDLSERLSLVVRPAEVELRPGIEGQDLLCVGVLELKQSECISAGYVRTLAAAEPPLI
ncbi:unnamed protein product [Arctogadus glacialis]